MRHFSFEIDFMPRHEDFLKIFQNFVDQYGPEEGETKYFAWLNEHGYDDTKPMPKKESFSWIGNVQSVPDEQNLIRGQALHPVKTLHPNEWPGIRVYLEEELQKSANTLSDKSLLLDHNVMLNGKVTGAQYEDGAIEYVAQLNDPRILDLIRTGDIKHCSVEFNWESLENVEGGIAPKGIEFTGLSLLKNFAPGDPLTTVEVWEGIIQTLKEAKLKEQTKTQETPKTSNEGVPTTFEGRLTFLETSKSLTEQQLSTEEIESKIDELTKTKQALDSELKQIANEEQPRRDEIWQKIDVINAELRAYEEALAALIARNVLSSDSATVEEGKIKEQNNKESTQPKTDKQRFIDHFGISEESFQKFYDLLGDELFKLLPEPGTKCKEQTVEAKKLLGEAILSEVPEEDPSDLISKKEVLALIPSTQVYRSWSYGPQMLVNQLQRKLGEVQ